jgi:hypothetical protein
MKTESELRSLNYDEVNEELNTLLKEREQIIHKLKQIENEMKVIAEITGSTFGINT